MGATCQRSAGLTTDAASGRTLVNRRTRNVAAFLALGAALAGGLLYASRYGKAIHEVSVVDAVPADAQVVMVANMTSIRRSPYQAVFADGAVPRMIPESEECGKNLSDRIETVAVWEPAEPGASFGMAARAPVTAEAVWACAQSAIGARGGTPTFTQVEGFRLINDDQLGPGAAQIAVRDDGLLLLARPATRSRMMDALGGRTPSSRTGSHGRMREELGHAGDMTVTVVVSPGLRNRIANWIGEPTDLLERVIAFAATVDLQPQTHLRIAVSCETPQACVALSERLERMRERASRSMPMRAIGLSALLDGTEMRVQGTRLSVQVKAAAQQVIDVIKRLELLEEAWEQAPSLPRAPSPRGSATDEVLRPAGSSSAGL